MLEWPPEPELGELARLAGGQNVAEVKRMKRTLTEEAEMLFVCGSGSFSAGHASFCDQL